MNKKSNLFRFILLAICVLLCNQPQLFAQNCPTANRVVSNCKSDTPNDAIGAVLRDFFTDGSTPTWLFESGGTFVENGDGTADLTAVLSQYPPPSTRRFQLKVHFINQTYTVPPGSPVLFNTTPNIQGWYYYNWGTATLTGLNDLAGAELTLTQRDKAAQIGTGGADQVPDVNKLGVSAWFSWQIVSQPTNTAIRINPFPANPSVDQGDLCFTLSGSPTICKPLGCVTFKAYCDLNKDNKYQAGEPGIPNLGISLVFPDFSPVPGNNNVFTGANGNYNFVNILEGKYFITLPLSTPDGKVLNSPQEAVPVTIVAGTTCSEAFAGYSSVDPCGNDVTPPVISGCPSNITLTTNSTCAVATWTAPTATDNCSTPTLTSNYNSGFCFPIGTTTVIYTATDAKGNKSTCSFTVTVTKVVDPCGNDVTPPVISGCPSNITLTTNSTCAVATWTAPTATDNCSTPTLTSNYNSGFCFPIGTTTVIYTATDAKGNKSTCSFTVTVTKVVDPCVDDVTPPVISGCPSNITLTTNSTCAVATWTAPTATDNCSTPTLTSNYNSGFCFPIGTTTVIYTATDAKGNKSTCSFTVTVKKSLDCNTVTGNTISLSCVNNIPVLTGASLAGFEYQWMRSTSGCPTTSSQVIPGVTGPTYSLPSAVTTVTYYVRCARPIGCTTWGPINESNCVKVSPSDCAVDPCLNDVTAPVISGCPSNITLTTSSSCAVATWVAPRATDNCSTPTLTSNYNSGFCFPVGTTTVTYTATDAKGNKSTCSFTVTVTKTSAYNGKLGDFVWKDLNCNGVQDSGEPGISGLRVQLLNSNRVLLQTVTTDAGGKYMFSGLAPGNYILKYDIPAGHVVTKKDIGDNNYDSDIESNGEETVTLGTNEVNITKDAGFCVDACAGDVTAPVITGCPSNITLTTGSTCAVATWVAPKATDNCSTPTLTSNYNSGFCFPIGTTTVTYTATDAKGNKSTCSFTVTVKKAVDCNTVTGNTISLSCVNNLPVLTGPALSGFEYQWMASTSGCPTTSSQVVPGVTGPTYSLPSRVTVVTYYVRCARPIGCTTWGPINESNCVKVSPTDCAVDPCSNDVTAPVISGCPSNITLTTSGSCASATWVAPKATDNCSTPTLTSNYNSGFCFPIGTTTVTYTATDAKGNKSTCSFTVTVTKTSTYNGKLGDFVWKDLNCNGVQESGEPGISGLRVQLLDANRVLLQTVTTDAGGKYMFSGLAPGNYILKYDIPAGHVVTKKDIGDNNYDSDIMPNGEESVTLGTNEVNITKDAGFCVDGCASDITAPVISGCPSNITLTTGSTCAVATWVAPKATDNCSTPTLTSNYNSGFCFPIGTTTVTYTATDAKGNKSTCSFTVTVKKAVDCNTVTGNTISLSCVNNLPVLTGAALTGFEYQWMRSTSGCPTTSSQVIPGVTGPTYSLPSAVTTVTYYVRCARPIGCTTWGPINESNCVKVSPTDCAVNPCSNDITAPVISGCPSNITLTTSGSCASATWVAPKATDNCSTPTLTSNYNSGFCFPIGTTTVTYTATDAKGNKSTCSFTVIVKKAVDCNTVTGNTISLSCVNNLPVLTGAALTGFEYQWMRSTSGCPTTSSQVIPGVTGPTYSLPSAVTTVTYFVRCARPIGCTTWGPINESNCVKVSPTDCAVNPCSNDITAPVISGCPSNITLTTSGSCASATWVAPKATDNCSTPTLTSNYNSGYCFPVGTTTVTYTATDAKGNKSTCSFTVTVSTNSTCSSNSNQLIFKGSIDYLAIGNTMSQAEARNNCNQNPSSSSTLSIPSGATVKAAYLYWSGSGSLDNAVTFNGTNVVAQGTNTFYEPSWGMSFFAAKADVTSLVRNSGIYTVSNLTWNNTGNYCTSNSAYGAWSMVVIYEKAGLPSSTIHVNSDNFRMTFPANNYTSTINCVNIPVGAESSAKMTIIAFEGDNYKGENLYINGVYCGNNNFRGQSGPNLDILTFNLGSHIRGGQTSLSYYIQSYYTNTIWGGAIEGLFDYVKVLKYNNTSTGSTYGLASNQNVFSLEAAAELNRTRLNWYSNTGDRDDYYVVQKLNNNSAGYEDIETINNTTKTEKIQYLTRYDNAPANGDNYYRIKVVQTDGTVNYTETKKINFNKVNDVHVYPNPASEELNIDLTTFQGKDVNIYMYNQFGQQVLFKNVPNAGNAPTTLDIAPLKSGNFIIRVATKGSRDVTKQVIITN